MKTNQEIIEKVREVKEEFLPAEESYFSAVKDKQEGKEVSDIDFLRIENEYELLKKELDTLLWTLEIEEE